MPLLSIDWGINDRDPLAFLEGWCEIVATGLIAQLPADRFVAETTCSNRARAVELAATLTPPAFDPPPTVTAPARFTDRVDLIVRDTSDDRKVVVVLFVTPDNKADSDASLAFAVRAAGFMGGGASVVIVDVLPGPPSWATHLHSLTGVYPLPRRPRGGEAPVLVVHPRVEGGAERYAVWHHAVAAGSPLPTVPVPAGGELLLRLGLEATYTEACAAARLF